MGTGQDDEPESVSDDDDVAAGEQERLAHLESVKRSMRAMMQPMGKLQTRSFAPLTYVEPVVSPDPPARPAAPAVVAPKQTAENRTLRALRERALQFQQRLDATEEVGLQLLGTPVTLRLGRLSQGGEQLLAIEGRLDGSDDACELIVHVSQLNVLMVRCAVPPTREPLRVDALG